MQATPVVCPKCNESVPLPPKEGSCYCVYCGTHILIGDNDNTYTYKSVDETRIKEAEILERMQMRHHEREGRLLKAKVVISLILGALAIFARVMAMIADALGSRSIGYGMEDLSGLLFMAIVLLWIADIVRQLTNRIWRGPTNQLSTNSTPFTNTQQWSGWRPSR